MCYFSWYILVYKVWKYLDPLRKKLCYHWNDLINLKIFNVCAEIRQRGRFAGFSLYVSTTGDIQGSTLCYKDGPQLPPLNFTTTCTTSGRYVIFYNERLDGVTYPNGYELINAMAELCQVTVQGTYMYIK